jgi:hypothetical protein
MLYRVLLAMNRFELTTLFSRDVFIFDHCIVYPSSITASKYTFCNKAFLIGIGGRRGRDHMAAGFQLPICNQG